MSKLITIIIPAYNEEETLPDIISRLTKLAKRIDNYDFEFLFVNDGLRSPTCALAKNLANQ